MDYAHLSVFESENDPENEIYPELFIDSDFVIDPDFEFDVPHHWFDLRTTGIEIPEIVDCVFKEIKQVSFMDAVPDVILKKIFTHVYTAKKRPRSHYAIARNITLVCKRWNQIILSMVKAISTNSHHHEKYNYLKKMTNLVTIEFLFKLETKVEIECTINEVMKICPTIRHLIIRNSNLWDVSFNAITFKNLTSLSFINCVARFNMDFLKDMPCLTKLNLNYSNFNAPEVFDVLTTLKITELSLRDTNIRYNITIKLWKMKNLQILDLVYNEQLIPESFYDLGDAKNMKILYLNSTVVIRSRHAGINLPAFVKTHGHIKTDNVGTQSDIQGFDLHFSQ